MRTGWAAAALAVVAAEGGGGLGAQDRTGGGVVHKTYVLDYSQGMPARTSGRRPQLVRAVPNAGDGRRSLVLTTPGTSRIVWRFAVPVRPSSAVLAIEHLSSGARARFGGSSIISVHLNGGCVVARGDVGSHGCASGRLRVDELRGAGGVGLGNRSSAGPPR